MEDFVFHEGLRGRSNIKMFAGGYLMFLYIRNGDLICINLCLLTDLHIGIFLLVLHSLKTRMDYYRKEQKEVLDQLHSSKDGLSSLGAASRLDQYGKNVILEREKDSLWKIFFEQFSDFLVWILMAAAAISILLGEWGDGIVIILILILNAALGFVQEYKAENAIAALKKMASLRAIVIRDGKKLEISTENIVPGDIVVLAAGEKVPADCYLLECAMLETQEAVLTGESLPVKKIVGSIDKQIGVADRKNCVFAGTIVTKGTGLAVVIATGMGTEFGKIAESLKRIESNRTPLQESLDRFGRQLGLIVIGICIVVFVAGIAWGGGWLEMFLAAVSLAVAAVPEGLPAVVTVTLAIGVQRMIKRNSLIRKLPSVETLGSTSVICSDKTGTITHNEMTVVQVYVDGEFVNVTGSGYGLKGEFSKTTPGLKTLLIDGLLCNDAAISNGGIIGDPTEAALLVSAAKFGLTLDQFDKKYKRVGEAPFDSERKMMSTVHTAGASLVQYTKGSPLEVLKRCNKIVDNGTVRFLNRVDHEKIENANTEMAKKALRVLGFAYREVERRPLEGNMIFIGLQGMIDPARIEVKDAVEKCHQAGIKVIMITGDQKETAEAVARQVGITGRVVTGAELDEIKQLNNEVEQIGIFARVNPEHKVRIVEALQKNGHVVAMTGDGVNDAPSLKKADIGVSMGIVGTDVAREASAMVLTDDNFASIVSAVEEGRGIFDNIRKFVEYLLSCNMGEVLTIFLGIVLGFPLPLVAIQILWMNLATDGLPALALAVEPHETGIMLRKPRDKSSVLSSSMFLRVLGTGLVITAGTLIMFNLYLSSGIEYARTVAFTTLVVFQLFHVLNSRSVSHSLFKVGLFSNMYVWGALIISGLLQLAVIYSPIASFFDTVPLSLYDWGNILLMSSLIFVFWEIAKLVVPEKHLLS